MDTPCGKNMIPCDAPPRRRARAWFPGQHRDPYILIWLLRQIAGPKRTINRNRAVVRKIILYIQPRLRPLPFVQKELDGNYGIACNKEILVTASEEGKLTIYTADTSTVLCEFVRKDHCPIIALHPELPLLVSGGDEKPVLMWNCCGPRPRIDNASILSIDGDNMIAFHPKRPIVAIASKADLDGGLYLHSLDRRSGHMNLILCLEHNSAVTSIVFHATLPLFVSACETDKGPRLTIYNTTEKDPKSWYVIQEFQDIDLTKKVRTLQFHPKAPLLCVETVDGMYRLYRPTDGLGSWSTCPGVEDLGDVYALEFHPTLPLMVVAAQGPTTFMRERGDLIAPLPEEDEALVNIYTADMRKGCVITANPRFLEYNALIITSSYWRRSDHSVRDYLIFHPTLPLLATIKFGEIVVYGTLSIETGRWLPLKVIMYKNSWNGRPCAFHPTLPLLFVATTKNTVAYNLDMPKAFQ